MSLPKVIDNYSTTIVGSFTASATTITVATPPTVITSGYLTIFDLNGDQLEKIKFTGVSGNDLTGCVRGLSFTVASDTPPGGLGQALQNGMEIKLADSVSYYNPIVDILNGTTATPAIMKNPVTRTITDSRHLTDKEYVDGISAAGIISMLVSDNGGITVNINSGTYLLNGAVKSYAGASAQSLTDDATNYVQLTDGVLAINTTGFTDDSIPLATVITASGDITSVVDNRPFYTGVDVKASSGLGRDATGIYVDLATNSGLEFSGGKLQAKVKSGGGITKDADGLSVATDFLSNNGVMIATETADTGTAGEDLAAGLLYKVATSTTTGTSGLGYGIPSSGSLYGMSPTSWVWFKFVAPSNVTQIVSIQINFTVTTGGTVNLSLYDAGPTDESNLIASKSLSVSSTGLKTFTFDTPITLSAGNIPIGIKLTTTDGTFSSIGVQSTQANGNQAYTSSNSGGTWTLGSYLGSTNTSSFGVNYNDEVSGYLYKATTTAADGIITTGGNLGDTIDLSTSGIHPLTGTTAGQMYYSNGSGAVTATPDGTKVSAGLSLANNTILLLRGIK